MAGRDDQRAHRRLRRAHATYFLPIEYAAVLSRGAGANSLAPAAQLLSLLASVEDLVVAGFHGGGGVMPQAYERLTEMLSTEKRQLIDESYIDALLRVDARHARAARKRGARARRRLRRRRAAQRHGARVPALGVPRLRHRPRAPSSARSSSAKKRACSNVDFVLGDAARIDEPRTYDLVLALESLHELPFPSAVLRNIAAALVRDGVFLMQEAAASSHLARNVEHPFAPMLYALSTACTPCRSRLREERGEALGRMWGKERALRMLTEAGFRERAVRDAGQSIR